MTQSGADVLIAFDAQDHITLQQVKRLHSKDCATLMMVN